MSRRISRPIAYPIVQALLVATAVATLARGAAAQTVIENSAEARLQLDLHVPDAALAPPCGHEHRNVGHGVDDAGRGGGAGHE